jgi:hypothetical protein
MASSFYDSLSLSLFGFFLSNFPESFSYSNNGLRFSLSLSLSLSPACQPSQKASATPTVFSRRRLSIPQTAVAAAAAASRVQFAPSFDHVSESES